MIENHYWMHRSPLRHKNDVRDVVGSPPRSPETMRTRWFAFLMLLLSVFLGQNAIAQVAIIGSGTTATTSTGNDPIDGYYKSFRYQVVYTAAELSAAGIAPGSTITSLGFSIAGDYAGGDLLGYTIKLANTTATNSAAHDATATTTVKNPFSYNPTVTAVGAFDPINFDTPFIWTGGNLLVDICSSGLNAYTSPYGEVRTIAGTTANGSRFVRSDSASQCGVNTATVNTNKPQIRFTYTASSACTGTPSPGNAIASSATACPNSIVNLSVQNVTAGSGVTNQWQSATASSGPWTNITGATNSGYPLTVTANGWYRNNVTCGGNTGSSNPVQVTLNPFSSCYPANYASETADEDISNVTVGSLSNSSNCATVAPGAGSILNRYSNFTGVTPPNLGQSSPISFSLTQTTCGTTPYGNGFQIFIDYNQNGSYDDAGEMVYNQPTAATGNHTKSGSFTVPANATLGITGMRVVVVETTFPTTTNYASTAYSYGETEDYVVNIVAPPACIIPTALTVGTITSNSATISWTASLSAPANGYEYEVRTSGAAGSGATGLIASGTTLAGVTTSVASGLSPNTAYNTYVRSNCGGAGYSGWTNAFAFTTPCNSVSLPLAQNFNVAATTATSPVCWSQQNVTGSVAIYQTITSPGPSGTSPVAPLYEGSGMMYFNSYSNSGSSTRLVSPAIVTTGTASVDVNFQWYNSITGGTISYLTEGVTVQWSTNGVIWNDFANNFVRRYGPVTGWTPISMTLPAGAGNISTLYVGLKLTANAGYDSYLDALSIQASPSCLAPTTLAQTAVGTTTATVSFTAPTTVAANGYEYYLATVNTAPTSGTTATGSIAAGATSLALSTLTANTAYYVWIRSVCSGVDTSAWSVGTTFTTLCNAISTFPWNEGFETTSTTFSCFRVINANADANTWGIGTMNPRTGARSAQMYTDGAATNNDYLITPQLALGSSAKRLKFWVRANSTAEPDEVSVRLSTTGTALGDFSTVILPSTPVTTTTYTEIIVDLSAYVNGTVYLAFVRDAAPANGWYLFLDDVTVENVPTCFKPSAVVISATTTTGATISWAAGAPAPSNGYQYEVRTSGAAGSGSTGLATSGTTAAGVLTVNAIGLTPATAYSVYVRSYCGGSDYSVWQDATVQFSTLCNAVSLPVAEGFDAATAPICWSTQIVAVQTGTKILYVASGTSPTTTPESGANMIQYNAYSNTNGGAGSEERLVSLPINTSGVGSVDVQFYWRNENSTSYNAGNYLLEGVQVQYSTNGGTTWTNAGSLIKRYDASLASGVAQWNLKKLTVLGAGNQASVLIGLVFHSSYGDNMYLDNLSIIASPPTIVSLSKTSVCTGGSVTDRTVVISGAAFTGATTVTFNGVAAESFTVNSDAQITALVSASATTGNVAVTGPNGAGTSAGVFTVNASPAVQEITSAGNVAFVCLPVTNTLKLSNVTPTGIWSSSNVDAATVDGDGFVSPVAVGNTVISFTVTDPGTGCATIKTFALAVNAPVEIASITPSQTSVIGGDTFFEVAVSGSGALSYFWEVCTDGSGENFEPVVNGGVYSNANTAILTLTNVPASFDGYFYQCTITGTCGAVTSDLTVIFVGDTGIISQPSNQTICDSGLGQASFTIVASDDVNSTEIANAGYQWQEDTGGDEWANIVDGGIYSGATSATLSLSGLTLSNSGLRYRCNVSGIGAAQSNPATLTVVQSVSVDTQPTAQAVCYSGGSSVFTVATSGGVASYQWQYSSNGTSWANVTTGVPTGSTYSGTASASLTVNTTAALPAGSHAYRALVIANTPCGDVPSASAQLLITTPAISGQPAAAIVIAGNTATFTVATLAASPTYQWQYATAVGGPYNNVINATPTGITYAGANTATLSVITTGATAVGAANFYRAIVSSPVGCSVISNGAKLTVNNYCASAATNIADDDIAQVVFGTMANPATLPTPLTNNAAATNTYTNFTGLTPVTYTQGVSYPIQVKQFNKAGYYACWTKVFFDWNNDGDFSDAGEAYNAAGGVDGPSSAPANGVVYSSNITIPMTAMGNIRMRVILDELGSATTNANGCGTFSYGEVEDYVINVIAAPACTGTPVAGTITSSVASVCISGSATLTATGYTTGVTGVTFQWYNSAGAIATATNFTYVTPVLTAPETYYFTATCANGGVPGVSNSITIGISNPAVLTTVPGNRCGTGTVVLSGTSSTNDTLNWYAGPTGGSPLFSGTTFTTPVISSTTNYYVSAGDVIAAGPSVTYCASTSTSTLYYISGFSTTAGLSNITNTGTGQSASGYGDYTSLVAKQVAGGSVNFAVAVTGGTFGIGVWVDWNNDGDFDDANEQPYASAGYVASASATINVPAGIAPGNRRMRVKADYFSTAPPACGTSTSTETEDYVFNVAGCESARQLVVATVTPAPALTVSATTGSICSGSPAAGPVLVTSNAADYDTYVWASIPAGGTVVGNQNTGWTFTAPATTTFTLTSSNANGCAQVATYVLTVNPVPAPVVITPAAATVCSVGNAVLLSASSGPAAITGACLLDVYGQYPFATYTPTTCNGTTPNVISTICYAGEYSVVAVSANTKYTFTSGTGDQVTISDASGTTVYAAGISPVVYLSNTAGQVRFYTHIAGCLDDDTNRTRSVICEAANAVVFSPTAGLFTDAAGLNAYNGTAVYSVYAKPVGTTIYTATATTALGCPSAVNVTVNVTQATTWYVDADNDGYGDAALPTVQACTKPALYAAVAGDCNDAIAAINPGQTEVLYNGVDDNCDGLLDNGNQITTSLLPSICNTTLASIGSVIGITTLAPGSAYTGWRIRATNGAQVQTIEKNVPFFSMVDFASYAYATTYTIDIELQRNGVWLGYYGPTCQISTPAILAEGGAAAVSPLQCGITLAKINTLVATTSIQGVTGYRFRVTNMTDLTGPNQVQVVTRALNWFTLQMLTRYNYGTTYQIEVAVKTTGDFGGYGSPCEISSPSSPSLVNCDAVIPSKNTIIACTSLTGVTQYRFQVTRDSDNASTTIDRSVNYFTFSNVPGSILTYGALYNIRVAVFTAGTWSPYGDACQITSPATTAKPGNAITETATAAFKVVAAPNPFAADFSIDVTTPSQENVMLRVYDMLGKLIESREVKVSEMISEKVGAQYPSGVYNVVVSQGEVVKTLRVIKR